MVSGKLEIYNGVCQITHPDYIFPLEKIDEIPSIEPIYKLFINFNKRKLNKLIKNSFEYLTEFPEWLSKETTNNLKFLTFSETIKRLHVPKTIHDIHPSNPIITRLAFDELLANGITLKILKDKLNNNLTRINLKNENLTLNFIKSLPFKLTEDQEKAIHEIYLDLKD